MEKFEKHIEIVEPITAVDALQQDTGLAKQQLKIIMQKGAVWLSRNHSTQRIRRAKKMLHKNDRLHFYYDPHVMNEQPPKAELIADESAYSIWFKPYGMYSQGSKWGDHCTLYRWAEQHLKPQRPAYIVHRLDRAASGLMILAHQKKVAAQFAELLQQRKIHKHYRVKVEGIFPHKTISCNLELDDKPALSHFTLLQVDESAQQSILDVSIESGRKHQIRRHLSSMGFPVVGDRLYGNKDSEMDLQLLAYSIAFNCPLSAEAKAYRLDCE